MQYVFSIFANKQDAQDAIEELKEKGFTANISMLARNDSGKIENEQLAKDGQIAAGTVAGSALGGLTGVLAGLTSVAIPGLGPVFVLGPFIAAWGITGAAIGALTGGLFGALIDLGVEESVARRYEERIRSGDVLVAVNATFDNQDEVAKIMEDHHAEEITNSNKTD